MAVVGCSAVALVGLVWPKALADGALATVHAVMAQAGGFYLGSVAVFLFMAVWLATSRHGRKRLGADDETPEFSTASWLAMLFSAGMGTGLMFWGVAEPITHWASPPVGQAATTAAARQALVLTDFHWGLHAWGIYCIAALSLGIFRFRHGTSYLPGAPLRRAFTGGWVDPAARAADLVAVLAVAFGVAGAMGMGVFQIRSGLGTLVGWDPHSPLVATLVIAALGVAYTASAATRLERGIQWLSGANMLLALVFLGAVLFGGRTTVLLQTWATSVVDYAVALPGLTLALPPWNDVGQWREDWTLTYLIWWVAWAPFVGVFVARISRGRTIREFVAGVLLVPTVFSTFWFAVLGGAALDQELHGSGGIAVHVEGSAEQALFSLLEQLPAGGVLAAVAMVLVFVFLVTSADSAAYVLGMVTSQGATEPPRTRKLVWGLVLGVLAATLVASNDINVVKAVSIAGAIPFTLVLLLQLWALVRVLRREPR
jgi:glycine betaine transporter